MGMDVHGLNPKQNKKLEEFPVLHKYRKMDDDDRAEALLMYRANHEDRNPDFNNISDMLKILTYTETIKQSRR